MSYQRPDNWDEPVAIPEVKPTFECILVPFDGSAPSERALAYAEIEARLAGGEIVVVVAYDPPAIMRRRGLMMVEHLRTEMEQDAKDLAQESVALLMARGSRARGVVVRGDVAQAIIETAEEESADLIIMGRRGIADVESRLLGSVAERVARQASAPVFLVS